MKKIINIIFSNEVITASKKIVFKIIVALVIAFDFCLLSENTYKLSADSSAPPSGGSSSLGDDGLNGFKFDNLAIWEDACKNSNESIDEQNCNVWTAKGTPESKDGYTYNTTTSKRNVYYGYDWQVELKEKDYLSYFSSSDLKDSFIDYTYNGNIYKTLKDNANYYLKVNNNTKSWYVLTKYVPNWKAIDEYAYLDNNYFNEGSKTNYFKTSNDYYNKFNQVIINYDYNKTDDNFNEWVLYSNVENHCEGNESIYDYCSYTTNSNIKNSRITANKNGESKFVYALQTLGTTFIDEDRNGRVYGNENFEKSSYIKDTSTVNGVKEYKFYVFDEKLKKFASFTITDDEIDLWKDSLSDYESITGEKKIYVSKNENAEQEIKEYFQYKQVLSTYIWNENGRDYINDGYAIPTNDNNNYFVLTGNNYIEATYFIEGPVIGTAKERDGQTKFINSSCQVDDEMIMCGDVINTYYAYNSNYYYSENVGKVYDDMINNDLNKYYYVNDNKPVNAKVYRIYHPTFSRIFTLNLSESDNAPKIFTDKQESLDKVFCENISFDFKGECYIGTTITTKKERIEYEFENQGFELKDKKLTTYQDEINGKKYFTSANDDKTKIALSIDDAITTKFHSYVLEKAKVGLVIKENEYIYSTEPETSSAVAEMNKKTNKYYELSENDDKDYKEVPLYNPSLDEIDEGASSGETTQTFDINNLGEVYLSQISFEKLYKRYLYNGQSEMIGIYSANEANNNYVEETVDYNLAKDTTVSNGYAIGSSGKKEIYNSKTSLIKKTGDGLSTGSKYYYAGESINLNVYDIYSHDYVVEVHLKRENGDHQFNGYYIYSLDYYDQILKAYERDKRFCKSSGGNNAQKELCEVTGYSAAYVKNGDTHGAYKVDKTYYNPGLGYYAKIESFEVVRFNETIKVSEVPYEQKIGSFQLSGKGISFVKGYTSNGVPITKQYSYDEAKKIVSSDEDIAAFPRESSLIYANGDITYDNLTIPVSIETIELSGGEKLKVKRVYSRYDKITTAYPVYSYFISQKQTFADEISNDNKTIIRSNYNESYSDEVLNLEEEGFLSQKIYYQTAYKYKMSVVETLDEFEKIGNYRAPEAKAEYVNKEGIVSNAFYDSFIPESEYYTLNETDSSKPLLERKRESVTLSPRYYINQNDSEFALFRFSEGSEDKDVTYYWYPLYLITENVIEENETKYSYQKYKYSSFQDIDSSDTNVENWVLSEEYAYDINDKIESEYSVKGNNTEQYSYSDVENPKNVKITDTVLNNNVVTIIGYSEDAKYYKEVQNGTVSETKTFNVYSKYEKKTDNNVLVYSKTNDKNNKYFKFDIDNQTESNEILSLCSKNSNGLVPNECFMNKTYYINERKDSSDLKQYELYKYVPDAVIGRELMPEKIIKKSSTKNIQYEDEVNIDSNYGILNPDALIDVNGAKYSLCSDIDNENHKKSGLKCLIYAGSNYYTNNYGNFNDAFIKKVEYAKYSHFFSFEKETGIIVDNNYYDYVTREVKNKNSSTVQYNDIINDELSTSPKTSKVTTNKNLFNSIDFFVRSQINNGIRQITNSDYLLTVKNSKPLTFAGLVSTNLNSNTNMVLTFYASISGNVSSKKLTIDGASYNITSGLNKIEFIISNTTTLLNFEIKGSVDSSIKLSNIMIETKESYNKTSVNSIPQYVSYQSDLVSENFEYSKSTANPYKTEYAYYIYTPVAETWYTQNSTLQAKSESDKYSYADFNKYYYSADGGGELKDITEIDLSNFDSNTVTGTKCNIQTCKYEKYYDSFDENNKPEYKKIYKLTKNYINITVSETGLSSIYIKNGAVGLTEATKNDNNLFGYYLSHSDDNNFYAFDSLNNYYIREIDENNNPVSYYYYQKYQDEGSWVDYPLSTEDEFDYFVNSYLAESSNVIGSLLEGSASNKESDKFINIENNSFDTNNEIEVEIYYEGKWIKSFKDLKYSYSTGENLGKYQIVFKSGNATLATKEFDINAINDKINVDINLVGIIDNWYKYNNILVSSSKTSNNTVVVISKNLKSENSRIVNSDGSYAGKYGFILKDDVIYPEIHSSWADDVKNEEILLDSTNYTYNRFKFEKYDDSIVYNAYILYKDEGHWEMIDNEINGDSIILDFTNTFGYYKYYSEDKNYEGWFPNDDKFFATFSNFSSEEDKYDYEIIKPYEGEFELGNQEEISNFVKTLKNNYTTGNRIYIKFNAETKYILKKQVNSLIVNNIYSFSDFQNLDLTVKSKKSPTDEEKKAVEEQKLNDRISNILSFYSKTSELNNYLLYLQPQNSTFRNDALFKNKNTRQQIDFSDNESPFITSKFLAKNSEENYSIPEHIMINRGLVNYKYTQLSDYQFACSDDLTNCSPKNDKLRNMEESYTGFAYDYYSLYGIYDSFEGSFKNYSDFLNNVAISFSEFFEIYFKNTDLKPKELNYTYLQEIFEKVYKKSTDDNIRNIKNAFKNRMFDLFPTKEAQFYLSLFTSRINDVPLVFQLFNSSMINIDIYEDNMPSSKTTYRVSPLSMEKSEYIEGTNSLFFTFIQSLLNIYNSSDLKNSDSIGWKVLEYMVNQEKLETYNYLDLFKAIWGLTDDYIVIEEGKIYYIYKKDIIPFYVNTFIQEQNISNIHSLIGKHFGEKKVINSENTEDITGKFISSVSMSEKAKDILTEKPKNSSYLKLLIEKSNINSIIQKTTGAIGDKAFAIALGHSIPYLKYNIDGKITGVTNPWSYVVYSSVSTEYVYDEEVDGEKKKNNDLSFNYSIKNGSWESLKTESNACKLVKTEIQKDAEKDFKTLLKGNSINDLDARLIKELNLTDKNILEKLGKNNLERLLNYANENCDYPFTKFLYVWYQKADSTENFYLDEEQNQVTGISNFSLDLKDVNISKSALGALTNFEKSLFTGSDDVGYLKESIANSMLLGSAITHTILSDNQIGVFLNNWAKMGLRTGVTKIVDGVKDLGCSLYSIRGSCQKTTTYNSLFYTHHSSNKIMYAFPISYNSENGIMYYSKITLNSKDFYNANIYNNNKNTYNFSSTFDENIIKKEETYIDATSNTEVSNSFVIKYEDTNGLESVNDLKIKISKATFNLTGLNSYLHSDDLNLTSFEYSLYYNSDNGCENNYEEYDGKCFLSDSKIIDENNSLLWRYTNGFTSYVDYDNKKLDLYFTKIKYENNQFAEHDSSLVINTLLPDKTYTLKLRLRTALNGFLGNEFNYQFKTTPDLINNPYGNNFSTGDNNLYQINDLNEPINPESSIFIYAEKEYFNKDWMNPLITKEARDAFYMFDSKTENAVNSCSEFDSPLSVEFCKVIPSRYKVKTYASPDDIIIGVRLILTNGKNEINVSNSNFAFEKGLGQSPLFTTKNNSFAFTSDLGIELKNFQKLFNDDIEIWKNNNLDKEYIDYVLDSSRFNLLVAFNGSGFKQYDDIEIKYQYYYAPVTTIRYIDYNQNNIYDDTNIGLTGFYDYYGNENDIEKFITIDYVEAKYKNEIHTFEIARKYYTFKLNNVSYSYILEYRDGKPVLTK